jgi:hypothetical protein
LLAIADSNRFIKKRQELKVMLYTVEDAIQIYHAKSSTLEFFAAKVPKAAWQGIRKADIEPAKEYYSDDIIVDFDLLDRAAYEEKVCGGAHSDLPDAAFPVLVIVKELPE